MLPKIFDSDFAEIKSHLEQLGGLVEKAVWDSMEALRSGDGDTEASQRFLERDREINEKRYFVQEKVSMLIIGGRPTEQDLQSAVSVFYVADELEQMGDYAKEISLLNLSRPASLAPRIPVDLTQMALKTTSMLRCAIHAFLAEDSDCAIQISKEAAGIDLPYIRNHAALTRNEGTDTQNIKDFDRLLGVTNELENLRNSVTNICERTLFLISGQDMDFQYLLSESHANNCCN